MNSFSSPRMLWRRSLCSNLGGIGPEKLYQATLNFVICKLCNTCVTNLQK